MSARNSVIRILSTFPHNSQCGPSCVSHRPYASIPAVSKPSITDLPFGLPTFIQKNLEKLKYEVVNSLLEHSSLAVPIDQTLSPASDFTKNLRKMAEYYFNQGGKLLRPTVSLLMAYACNQLNLKRPTDETWAFEEVSLNQYKIAIIAEMIHTASLVHDDVIDEADVRRGSPTVNALWGNKMAVLVGDFILARATQILCSIGRPNVIAVMALIIEDLVKGEFMQMTSGGLKDSSQHFDEYMAKTYSKTASLFANSCKSAAMLADISESTEATAFEYGRSLGIAFQLVDDMLDFVSTVSVMGKPTANDLKLGLATAPVLFAAQEHPELNELISRRFAEEGDVMRAWELVVNSNGLERTRSFARQYAQQAADMAKKFPNGDGVRDQLVELAMGQLRREK